MSLHNFITALEADITVYDGEILKIIHGSSKTKKIRLSYSSSLLKGSVPLAAYAVTRTMAPVFEMSSFLRTTILAGPKEVNLEQRPSGGYNISKIIKAADHERNR